MLFPSVVVLFILPVTAYFEVDTTGTVEDHCPFSWQDNYYFDEDDMSSADADILYSCNARPSQVELASVNNMINNGLSMHNATANFCFGRGCWWAEAVTMEAVVSIPPTELRHNGFPFSNTFNLSTLPYNNFTGICIPPRFMEGGGYLCLVDRPPKIGADNRRALVPDAGSSTWLLEVNYAPKILQNFAKPTVDDKFMMMILVVAAILIALILIGVLAGGRNSKPRPPKAQPPQL